MRNNHSEQLRYDPSTKQVIVLDNDSATNSGKKKGIIYARVSTEEQKTKGNGINAQIKDCEQWAKMENVEIIKYFKDEAISGTNLNRPWFLSAIRFIEKQNQKSHNIDYFICWSTSRFSRSSKLNQTFDMVARVEATGTQLVAVGNGGIQDLNSEEWLMTFGMYSIVDALESMRWKKRVRYGQKWKIYEWYRPFSAVPLWYKRVIEHTWKKEVKVLIKDKEVAPILQEWLEMFAQGIILTKQQLFEYFQERWLKSNSPKNKSWKLHPSIIDHILDLWKLLIYTGNITYPKRGINEIIPARHPAIISMDTMDKIVKRLEKDYGMVTHKKRKYDQDADEYPLKRILLCPECHKGATKWKSKSKTWDYHHYYGCNTKWCKLYKKSLKRDDVHNAVKERLREITPPPEAITLFKIIFEEEWNNAVKDSKSITKNKKKEIKLLKDEMERIETAIDKLSETENLNMKLLEKKQERWAELNQRVENLELEIADTDYSQEEMRKVFNEAKTVISNPESLRDLDDVEIKQLLIRVCFNNKIYYRKNQGLHTPEISVIYLSLGELNDPKTCMVKVRGIEPLSECHN